MATPRDIPRLLRRGVALHTALALPGAALGLGQGWAMAANNGGRMSHGEPLFLMGIAFAVGLPLLILELTNARRLRLAATTHVSSVLDHCRRCGYNLIGGKKQGACPECGAAYIFANEGDVVGGGTPVASPPLSYQLAMWRRVAWGFIGVGGFGIAFCFGFFGRRPPGLWEGAIMPIVLLLVFGMIAYQRIGTIARAYATRPLGQCMNCGRDLTDRIRDGTCETCGERFTVRSRG